MACPSRSGLRVEFVKRRRKNGSLQPMSYERPSTNNPLRTKHQCCCSAVERWFVDHVLIAPFR